MWESKQNIKQGRSRVKSNLNWPWRQQDGQLDWPFLGSN